MGRHFSTLHTTADISTILCEMSALSLSLPLMCPAARRGLQGPAHLVLPREEGKPSIHWCWESQKELTRRQLCPYPVHCIQCLPWAALATPWDPSSTSLASRCPHQPALTERRRNARLAANTHHWLLPSTCSPADTAWQPTPGEHRKQRSLEVNPSASLCPLSWHGLQKWPH